ncbi:MAG: nuclear transport factor 2 family protein, partial [Actinobacteria bacterium]
MGRWSRDELEKAFEAYLEAGARAGASGDWSEWPDIFTEDATYIEHHFGTFRGRDEIRKWITETMGQFP